MSVRVLLVDDHPVVRSGLRAVLEATGRVEVVGEAASGEQALALVPGLNPDVVLMDLNLGDGLDGVATTQRILTGSGGGGSGSGGGDDARARPPAVLILTTYDHDADIVRAVEAGASGYLLKDASPEAIADAVAAAARGETVLASGLAQRLVQRMRAPAEPTLTPRELEVLRLVQQGTSNRAIAKAMFVSEATVKTHLVHTYEKLGVDNRTAAVTTARERGLL
ncbi:response regulator transcription factor [Ornithinimicrobium faecis]|uniref:Response regulator transcription factor n=1 Tax=Ornithinimicrobium faecis TaxID=2934158 RepID=A0ABY4YT55_9MICO|nr:response regulator transcription factor [Ornithinimicrobium sp. HY1793]USQ79759.1 response regulator transcription factor [Ornithinimicrobium sp. HY1793]